MSPQHVFLAVSGGIVTTEALLLDSSGHVYSRVQGGSSSPRRLGLEKAAEVVGALAEQAVSEARLDRDASISRLVAFLADVDLPIERREATSALAHQFPGSEVTVENDIHAILWAGLRRPAGAAVYCAEGINAIARSATGRTAGYVALGAISGDWGGGLSLGREVLFAASRAEDGRGPATSLRFQLLAAFRRRMVQDVVVDLQLGENLEKRLMELVPLLFRADTEGDVVARQIVDRLANEVVGTVAAAMQRAVLPPSGSDVILAGEILTTGHERLDMLLDTQFADVLPGAAIHRLSLPPVAGAALAALGAEQGGPVRERTAVRLQRSLRELAHRTTGDPLRVAQ